MGRTVVEKVARARAGEYVTIRPRHVMTHDNTAAVIEKFSALNADRIHDRRQPVIVLDHDIQNRSPANLARYRAIERFASEHGIDFHPAGSGIGHQIMVERGYVEAGALVVAADSHATMYGGLGAVGTPVVRTDAAAIWATGECWWQVPHSVRVTLEGRLPDDATAKDLVLLLCATYGGGEVLNRAIEFAGAGAATLELEQRLTVANMTTEWGGLVGWFSTEDSPVEADRDAQYAAEILVDLSEVSPHVSGPDSVRTATPLAEIETRRVAVDKAYLVSCVNSRDDDLRAAAAVVRGKKIAAGVELYVAAASRDVERRAVERGDWQALLEAGAIPLPSGCGPCIGLGAGLLEPGQVGISATNRNFKGRMGSPEASCYLASPAVVASSALAGSIRGSGPTASRRFAPRIEFRAEAAPQTSDPVELVPGFPRTIRGRLIFVPEDNVDTDGIYDTAMTYREDVPPEQMAAAAFANYDPGLAARIEPGDVLLAGANFGCGSSREQAATALVALGIPLVVAASFAQTFLRNAFNNGLPCITCPELVAELRRHPEDGGTVAVDFSTGTIELGTRAFRFAPLGAVVQRLLARGGIIGRSCPDSPS